MRHNSILAILLALLLSIPSVASAARIGGIDPCQRGIRLTPAQRHTIEAAGGRHQAARHRMPVGGTRLATLPIRRFATGPLRMQTSTGSTFEGWRTPDWEGTPGWYALDWEGTQELQWQYDGGVDDYGDPIAFPFNIGFYRQGKIYAIGASMVLYWALVEHGVFTRDGTVLDYVPASDFAEDLSEYAFSVAYDPAADKAYAFTLNADGSGYMFQSLDPDTWKYTVVNPNVPLKELCNGMAVNTRDGKLYGITPENKFVRVDTATGNLEILADYAEVMPTSSGEAMVYSPYDDAFVYVRPDNDAYDTKLVRIDARTYQYSECATLEGTVQYPILITPDQLVADTAPAMPRLQALSYVGGSLVGTATIVLPEGTFGGAALAGPLTAKAFIDGVECATVQGQPGDVCTLSLPATTAGRHRFAFAAANAAGQGPMAEQVRYIGFDTPAAPQEVVLTETEITWQAVTTTVHGGYLDADSLYYNVYVDGHKMNAGPVRATTFALTLPDGQYSKHLAAVEAVNHGLVSARTGSNGIVAGQPLPLPFYSIPSEADYDLFQPVTVGGSEWGRWMFGGSEFSCYTRTYDDGGSDEWLILPPVAVADAGELLRVAAVASTEGEAENLAIAYATTPDPAAMTVAEAFDAIAPAEGATMESWFAVPAAGTYYIAFRTHKSRTGSRIALSHFAVEASGIATTAPARVADLTATAAPHGANSATVSFTMPAVDVAGAPLPATATLTATVSCATATATATGAPGSRQSVELATATGFNDIRVSVDNSVPATVRVYTGLDIPSPISAMNVECSDDNLSMTLTWDDPTTGINGGWVDPAGITYSLAQVKDEYGSWAITNDLGDVNGITLGIDPRAQVLVQAGIVACNASGHADSFRSTTQSLGTPIALPLVETFESYKASTEPMFAEAPDASYESSPGYRDLGWDGDVRGGGIVICLGGTGSATVSHACINLPKVSLLGASNPCVELQAYCGPDAGALHVMAYSYATEPVELGTIQSRTADKSMQTFRFPIPAKFAAKNWTLIKLESDFAPDENIYVQSVKVDDYLANDLALTALNAPQFMLTGEKAAIGATVSNVGLNAQAAPQLTLEVATGGRTIATLSMQPEAEGDMAELTSRNYAATYTPDAEAGNGEIVFTVRAATADDRADNDTITTKGTVCRGNQPIVNDLKAEANDGGATLTWSEPDIAEGHEGFENYAPWSYYSQLGDFTAIDADGLEVTYVNVCNIPGAQKPKAWQVYSQSGAAALLAGTGKDSSWAAAHSGDRMIVAFVPFSVWVGEGLVANDWLVSPKLVAGSDFSFFARPFENGTENIEVLTSDSPDAASFTLLQALHPFGSDWTEYHLTLPAGHTYFAIRYISDSDNGVGICLDDIAYNRDGEARDQIAGYDILREGQVVAENVSAPGTWADTQAQGSYYNVRPMLSGLSGTKRGALSNTAWLEQPTKIETPTAAKADSGKRYNLGGAEVEKSYRGIVVAKNRKVVR